MFSVRILGSTFRFIIGQFYQETASGHSALINLVNLSEQKQFVIYSVLILSKEENFQKTIHSQVQQEMC